MTRITYEIVEHDGGWAPPHARLPAALFRGTTLGTVALEAYRESMRWTKRDVHGESKDDRVEKERHDTVHESNLPHRRAYDLHV
jgi:hypothetical protein